MIAVALLSLTGCIAAEPDHAPLASLQAMAEAGLFYPGSEVLGELNRPAEVTFDGTLVAGLGRRLGSVVQASDIEAWYADELARRGWQPGVTDRFTSETMARGWIKDGIRFRFALPRRDDPQGATPEQEAKYPTIFDIRLIGDR